MLKTPGALRDVTTVTFAMRFADTFSGPKKLFVLALSHHGDSSGWMQPGEWTVATPLPSEPLVGPFLPLNGSARTQTFTGTFTHSVSASRLYLAYILILPTPNIVQYTAAGSCLVEYNRISHAMRLINEAGDNWLGPVSGVPLAQGGTLTNSRCSLNIGSSSAQISDSKLIVNASVTFSPTFTGTFGTFLQASDVNNVWSGMTQFGNWIGPVPTTAKPGPYIVDISPANATGAPVTYTLTVGHTAGAAQIGVVHLRINESIVGGAPCHIVYFPGSNTINLVNEAQTDLAFPNTIALGSAPIGTHRCVLETGATRTISGNDIILTLPIRSITPIFPGIKSIYANVFDLSGKLTHWVKMGTLNIQWE